MNKKKPIFNSGSLVIIVLFAVIAVIVWGAVDRSKNADELQPDIDHPHTFTYAPSGQSIWLGTHTGVFEQQEGKWTKTLTKLGNKDVMGLEIHSDDPENIVASGHGFVLRSTDGGASWGSEVKGLPDDPDAHHLTSDPNDPNHLFVVLANPTDNVYESVDGGMTWKKAGSIPAGAYTIAVSPKDSSALLAGSEQGLFRYEMKDGEVDETKINNNPAFSILSLSSGQVIVMNEGNFLATTDFQSWSPMNVPLEGKLPLGMKASKTDPNKLVIVTDDYSVFESNNGGANWQVTEE